MPSLTRMLVRLATVAFLVYAGLAALATFVTPEQHEIEVAVPLDSGLSGPFHRTEAPTILKQARGAKLAAILEDLPWPAR